MEALSLGFSATVGIVVLMGCFFFLNHLTHKCWRRFSDRLGRKELAAPRHKLVSALVVISDKPDRELWATGYHKYPPVVFGLHPDGLSVRIRWPFGALSVPFVLPFAGMKIERTSWPDLAGDFVAISHDIVPDAFIIAYDEVVDWAHAHDPRVPHPGPRAQAGPIGRRFGKAAPVHSQAERA